MSSYIQKKSKILPCLSFVSATVMESIPPVVDVLFPPPPPPPLDKDGEFDGNVERSVREL